jgi:hypothetical protein
MTFQYARVDTPKYDLCGTITETLKRYTKSIACPRFSTRIFIVINGASCGLYDLQFSSGSFAPISCEMVSLNECVNIIHSHSAHESNYEVLHI